MTASTITADTINSLTKHDNKYMKHFLYVDKDNYEELLLKEIKNDVGLKELIEKGTNGWKSMTAEKLLKTFKNIKDECGHNKKELESLIIARKFYNKNYADNTYTTEDEEETVVEEEHEEEEDEEHEKLVMKIAEEASNNDELKDKIIKIAEEEGKTLVEEEIPKEETAIEKLIREKREKKAEEDRLFEIEMEKLLIEDHKNKNPSLKSKIENSISNLKTVLEDYEIEDDVRNALKGLETLVMELEEEEIKIVKPEKNPKRNKARQNKVKSGTLDITKKGCLFCGSDAKRSNLKGAISHLNNGGCRKRPKLKNCLKKYVKDIDQLNKEKNLKEEMKKIWKDDDDWNDAIDFTKDEIKLL
tara:strand:- start:27 stop:1103 length:1077 start_codon:yes stop_codon:yes gene_type:complete